MLRTGTLAAAKPREEKKSAKPILAVEPLGVGEPIPGRYLAWNAPGRFDAGFSGTPSVGRVVYTGWKDKVTIGQSVPALASKPATAKPSSAAPTDTLTLAFLETKIPPPKRAIGSVVGVTDIELNAFRETRIALPMRGEKSANAQPAVVKRDAPPVPPKSTSTPQGVPREIAIVASAPSPPSPPSQERVVLVDSSAVATTDANPVRKATATKEPSAAEPVAVVASTSTEEPAPVPAPRAPSEPMERTEVTLETVAPPDPKKDNEPPVVLPAVAAGEPPRGSENDFVFSPLDLDAAPFQATNIEPPRAVAAINSAEIDRAALPALPEAAESSAPVVTADVAVLESKASNLDPSPLVSMGPSDATSADTSTELADAFEASGIAPPRLAAADSVVSLEPAELPSLPESALLDAESAAFAATNIARPGSAQADSIGTIDLPTLPNGGPADAESAAFAATKIARPGSSTAESVATIDPRELPALPLSSPADAESAAFLATRIERPATVPANASDTIDLANLPALPDASQPSPEADAFLATHIEPPKVKPSSNGEAVDIAALPTLPATENSSPEADAFLATHIEPPKVEPSSMGEAVDIAALPTLPATVNSGPEADAFLATHIEPPKVEPSSMGEAVDIAALPTLPATVNSGPEADAFLASSIDPPNEAGAELAPRVDPAGLPDLPSPPETLWAREAGPSAPTSQADATRYLDEAISMISDPPLEPSDEADAGEAAGVTNTVRIPEVSPEPTSNGQSTLLAASRVTNIPLPVPAPSSVTRGPVVVVDSLEAACQETQIPRPVPVDVALGDPLIAASLETNIPPPIAAVMPDHAEPADPTEKLAAAFRATRIPPPVPPPAAE